MTCKKTIEQLSLAFIRDQILVTRDMSSPSHHSSMERGQIKPSLKQGTAELLWHYKETDLDTLWNSAFQEHMENAKVFRKSKPEAGLNLAQA